MKFSHALFLGLLLPVAVRAAGEPGEGAGAAATPRAALRELTTDRPDATESPTTVDAGHVQLELSLAAHTRDRRTPERDGGRSEEWNVLPVNVRFGLRPNLEVQVVVDNLVRTETRGPAGGRAERATGWGDVTLRMKRNLRGNDGDATAFAVMPWVKLPTASGDVGNGRVEGGLILPATFSLGGVALAAMTEVDLVRDDADRGYTLGWFNTLTHGFAVTPRLGAFVELTSRSGTGRHALTFNTGLTYAVHPDLQLDAGVNLGVSRAAPDRVLFAGMSRRF